MGLGLSLGWSRGVAGGPGGRGGGAPRPVKQAHTKPESKAGSWLSGILRPLPRDARYPHPPPPPPRLPEQTPAPSPSSGAPQALRVPPRVQGGGGGRGAHPPSPEHTESSQVGDERCWGGGRWGGGRDPPLHTGGAGAPRSWPGQVTLSTGAGGWCCRPCPRSRCCWSAGNPRSRRRR